MQGFSGKNWGKRKIVRPKRRGNIKVKRLFKKHSLRTWTGLIWFKIMYLCVIIRDLFGDYLKSVNAAIILPDLSLSAHCPFQESEPQEFLLHASGCYTKIYLS